MSRNASILYAFLVSTARFRRSRFVDRLWTALWSYGMKRYSEPVSTVLHGQKASINFGNPYPIVAKALPRYNAPLVELVAQTFAQKQRTLRIIDIGAGIGDSVLLLRQRCPGMVQEYLCFEGEEGFFRLLRANVGHLPSVRTTLVLLSDAEKVEPALVRAQHAGTATPRGHVLVPARTLDDVLSDAPYPDFVDVMKIDTDGFDGKILAGSQATLELFRPAVIFEWHPIACASAGVDPHLAFQALEATGYVPYVFFDKLGNFSHFMYGYNDRAVASLADFCTGDLAPGDWHYDVVALPEGAELSEVGLAHLCYHHDQYGLGGVEGGPPP